MSRWDFSFPSPVNDILRKPGFTLEDLLNEDEVVAEIRNQNEELLKFMSSSTVVKQLISYMVKEPGADASDAIKFRYPVVAKELLAADVEEINRVLFSDSTLLDHLFGFYETENVNLLLSNLVCAVAASLVVADANKMMAYLKKDTKWLKNIVRHVESAAVADFLVKLMNADLEDGKKPKAFLIEAGLVEIFLQNFDKSNAIHHSDVYQAAADLLLNLKWEDPLVQRFASQKSLDAMFSYILDDSNKTAQRYVPKVVSIILKSLVGDAAEGYDSDEEGAISRPDPTASLDLLPVITTTILGHMPALLKIVQDDSGKEFTLPDRNKVKTFGPHRAHILEMIDDLMVLNYFHVQGQLIEKTDLFTNLFELILRFPGNTFCHKVVQNLFEHVLEQSGVESQLNVLKKSNIVTKMIAAHDAVVPKEAATPRQSRKDQQYLPFVYTLAKTIQHIAEAHPQVTEYLNTISAWAEFSAWVTKYKESQAVKPVQAEKEDMEAFHADYDEAMEAPDSSNYLEGRDHDEDDLDLEDDVDMDSSNDADDYDIDQAEILLTKQEIEAFA